MVNLWSPVRNIFPRYRIVVSIGAHANATTQAKIKKPKLVTMIENDTIK